MKARCGVNGAQTGKRSFHAPSSSMCGSVPSAPTSQMCQYRPPGFDSNAIVRESYDQLGFTFWFGPMKTGCKPEPSAFTTATLDLNMPASVNASRVPSGDHAARVGSNVEVDEVVRATIRLGLPPSAS